MRASFGPTVWMFPMATTESTIHSDTDTTHENAIKARIHANLQNALRRREQLDVCQDNRKSFKRKSNSLEAVLKSFITILIITNSEVKKPKAGSLSYALFSEPAGERPFCRRGRRALYAKR